MKPMFGVVFILVLINLVIGNETDFTRLDAIHLEMPCASAGGLCVLAADCPQLTEKRGLCPTQQAEGVECCMGFSRKETRCQKHGGSCVPSTQVCKKRFLYQGATDCSHDQKCCIYVL